MECIIADGFNSFGKNKRTYFAVIFVPRCRSYRRTSGGFFKGIVSHCAGAFNGKNTVFINAPFKVFTVFFCAAITACNDIGASGSTTDSANSSCGVSIPFLVGIKVPTGFAGIITDNTVGIKGSVGACCSKNSRCVTIKNNVFSGDFFKSIRTCFVWNECPVLKVA